MSNTLGRNLARLLTRWGSPSSIHIEMHTNKDTSAALWYMICCICRGVWCQYMFQWRPVCRDWRPDMSVSTGLQRDTMPIWWVFIHVDKPAYSFPLHCRRSYTVYSNKLSATLCVRKLTYIFRGQNVVKALMGPVQTLCFHFAKAEWACSVAVIGWGCSVGVSGKLKVEEVLSGRNGFLWRSEPGVLWLTQLSLHSIKTVC